MYVVGRGGGGVLSYSARAAVSCCSCCSCCSCRVRVVHHPTVDGPCGVFEFKLAPKAGIALYLTTVGYIHFDELEGRPASI